MIVGVTVLPTVKDATLTCDRCAAVMVVAWIWVAVMVPAAICAAVMVLAAICAAVMAPAAMALVPYWYGVQAVPLHCFSSNPLDWSNHRSPVRGLTGAVVEMVA